MSKTARTEYGDFQTNAGLANAICQKLAAAGVRPQVVIEPTFGQGSFILAALRHFPTVEKIYGVEIHQPYCQQAEQAVEGYFLEHPEQPRPEIKLLNTNVFGFDWAVLRREVDGKNLLLLGNPPWVTNAALSGMDSANVPRKSNQKNHNGLDAMTGKANFDLAEFILFDLLNAFQHTEGNMAFLVKNAVTRNILTEQPRRHYRIGYMEQQKINAQQEFGAAVDAGLFVCQLNTEPATTCRELDFYTQKLERVFGWSGNKFISNTRHYAEVCELDGVSPHEWRQGIKHDCSKVMELEAASGECKWQNGLGETVALELDLVFGLLKSSDLKNVVINWSRKHTIVTQSKIGQDTRHIRRSFPQTWAYLETHAAFLNERKSSIYRSAPPYAIFGVGDYSFKPYKVAISGMYKQTQFSLVLPSGDGKCLMLDDTCYFLSFDVYEEAAATFLVLNSPPVQKLLMSLIFWDAKRVITKEILMRINLNKAIERLDFQMLKSLAARFSIDFKYSDWEQMQVRQAAVSGMQLQMF